MPLSVLLKIPNQGRQTGQAVTGVPEGDIASVTKQPSNLTRLVAVVNMEGSSSSGCIGAAGFTSTLLFSEHPVELIQRHPIKSFQIGIASVAWT